jgi:hypothetical protein
MAPTLGRRTVAGIGSALVVVLLSACLARPVPVAGSEATPADDGTTAARPATVVVVNKSTYPVTVYVVQTGSVTWRLGTVTAGETADYSLDPSYFSSGRLDLMAEPKGFAPTRAGGTGAVRPGAVVVWGRRIVVFTIQPDIHTSTVTVE